MDPNGIYRAVLLALIFASYAVRQRGLRPGELVLVLTMSLYFAEGSGVAWGNLAWFLFAAAAGLLSLWLWQFVLLPYDPRRSLRNSVQAFYRRAAALVGAVDAGLATAPAPADADIGRERSGAAPAAGQAQPPRDRGAVPGRAGAGRLVEDAAQPTAVGPFQHRTGVGAARRRRQRSVAPYQPPCRDSHAARPQPASLQEALVAGSPDSMQALAAENAALQTEIRAYASAVRTSDGAAAGITDAPGLRLGWLPRCVCQWQRAGRAVGRPGAEARSRPGRCRTANRNRRLLFPPKRRTAPRRRENDCSAT